jgi:hypothetical protein
MRSYFGSQKRKDVIALSNPNNALSSIRRIVLLCGLLIAVLATVLVTLLVSLGQHVNIATLSTKSQRLDPASTLGVAVNIPSHLAGMPWVRLGYPSCDLGNLSGATLKNTIQSYHNQGMRVLLIICQPRPSQLFNTAILNDAAQGGADAVQCGNEEMKYDPTFTNYVPPGKFAKFFDLCQSAMHRVSPSIPVILGALDPLVAPSDNGALLGQVHYLDVMQTTMNTQLHPGGHWTWRSQILGLINSWHDGFPSPSVNNLLGLFSFWAYQFHVNLYKGELGNHLWVVEDTGCFKGCGVNVNNKAQVAAAHILSLVVDVSTTMQFRVPFFFFSARDFLTRGVYWPIGILDIKGNPKPLRQDLRMGSRTLVMSCARGKVVVADQERLLATLYQGCKLPANAYWILSH